MTIASIGSVTASLPLDSAVTAPRDTSALDALAQGRALRALDSGRTGIDQIKADLTKLRDTLQAARSNAEAVPGATELTPITSQVGTRTVVVGYEVGPRPSLAVQDALAALSSTVSRLVTTVGSRAGSFASDVSALLKSSDLAAAVDTPDQGSIDAALGRIDALLAKAAGLRAALASTAAAAAQVDLSGVLVSGTAAGR